MNVPLGGLTFLLAHRHLPADRRSPRAAGGAGFDTVGTLLLALTLAVYALAVTTGRGHFGALNVALLLLAASGGVLFVLVEGKTVSPLIRLSMLRDPVLAGSLAMSALVSTVMMATLVVGPFYLSRGLGLDVALVGFALSAGPLFSALTGVPAGIVVDRLGARRMTRLRLGGMLAGSAVLAVTPGLSGVAAYIAPIVVLTAGYALFQAANNTEIMTHVGPEQRGVTAGMLGLSRNLGLITGASVMGALFAFASAASDITAARPEAVASGMRVTFGAAAALSAVALATSLASRAIAGPRPRAGRIMSSSKRLARIWSEWRAPLGLIILSLVPMLAGGARLGQLAGGAAVTAANARFFASPVPVVLHIVGASTFSLLGALQFAPALRRRPRRWHRISGRIAVPAGIVAALSGLWMSVFYDLPASDNALLRAFRLVVGVGMVVSLALGLAAVRKRDFGAHRAWIMRGYALGIGAGTQVLTTVPWILVVGEPTASTRALLMGAGWAINLAVAERLIRTRPIIAVRV